MDENTELKKDFLALGNFLDGLRKFCMKKKSRQYLFLHLLTQYIELTKDDILPYYSVIYYGIGNSTYVVAIDERVKEVDMYLLQSFNLASNTEFCKNKKILRLREDILYDKVKTKSFSESLGILKREEHIIKLKYGEKYNFDSIRSFENPYEYILRIKTEHIFT